MVSGLMSWWDRYEGPTWVLAVLIYAAWIALTLLHARLAWWVVLPLGAIITAWHASLQHETIHAMARVPRVVRTCLAWPPLGLGYPYALYHREHRKHHRNEIITDPVCDPETFYHSAAQWRRYHPLLRAIFLANQTLAGRITIGAPLRLWSLAAGELRRLRSGDRSNVRDWIFHALAVALLFAYVCGIAHMPWWQYVVLIALPGLSLSMLRSFIEHRAADEPGHRTAIVENDFPFGLLFLYNNLHAVHHHAPSLPWYKIRRRWLSGRDEILARNGNFHLPGYRAVARRWLFSPVFVPLHDGDMPG